MPETKTVLIVDDEADVIEFVSLALEDIAGIATISATDGKSGLAKAKEARPDLIILDVEMPGRDGFLVFHDLKRDEATRGIPVIMLTGIRQKAGIGFTGADMGKFMDAEPDAYLEKPVDPAQLRQLVAGLL